MTCVKHVHNMNARERGNETRKQLVFFMKKKLFSFIFHSRKEQREKNNMKKVNEQEELRKAHEI